MPASTRTVLVAASLGACLAALVFAPAVAQVYTWKDAKGVTHYSDSPPPKGTQARTVAVPPPPPAPVAKPQPKVEPAAASTAVARPVAEAPDPALVQALAEQRAVQCKQAQDNLKVLQANAAVAVDNDGDGRNDAVLDTAEREKQTTTMQAAIQANCIQ